jgi:hypothetical protein
MVKILSEGDFKHRVEDEHEGRIGWINGRTIGFRGFATEADAREAALSARQALDRTLRAHHPGWEATEVVLDRLHLVHDGASEWFFDGRSAVARLLRPQRRAYDASFGIELVLPFYSSEGLAVAAAYAVSLAVEPYRDVPPPVDASDRAARPSVLDTSTYY